MGYHIVIYMPFIIPIFQFYMAISMRSLWWFTSSVASVCWCHPRCKGHGRSLRLGDKTHLFCLRCPEIRGFQQLGIHHLKPQTNLEVGGFQKLLGVPFSGPLKRPEIWASNPNPKDPCSCATVQHQHIELLNLFNQVMDHRAVRQISSGRMIPWLQWLLIAAGWQVEWVIPSLNGVEGTNMNVAPY